MSIQDLINEAKKRIDKFKLSSKEEIEELNLECGKTFDIEFIGCDLSSRIMIEDVMCFEAKLYPISELKEEAIIISDVETNYDFAFYYLNEFGQDSYKLVEECKINLPSRPQYMVS